MRMQPLVWALTALGVGLALAGCGSVHVIERISSKGGGTDGSGKQKTEARKVGSFDRIVLEGAADVTVKIGPDASVMVTTDDNLLALLTTTVDDDTLTIESTEEYSTDIGMKVFVTVPSLTSLHIYGAGDVDVDGVAGGTFDGVIRGAGDLKVTGSVERSGAEIAGAGDIDFSGLKSKSADVTIAGAGDVRVHASESLIAKIRGAGDIRYSGQPKSVTRSIFGAGDIHSVEERSE